MARERKTTAINEVVLLGQDENGILVPVSVAADGSFLIRNMTYDYDSLAWLPQPWGAATGGGTEGPSAVTRVDEAGETRVDEAGVERVEE